MDGTPVGSLALKAPADIIGLYMHETRGGRVGRHTGAAGGASALSLTATFPSSSSASFSHAASNFWISCYLMLFTLKLVLNEMWRGPGHRWKKVYCSILRGYCQVRVPRISRGHNGV